MPGLHDTWEFTGHFSSCLSSTNVLCTSTESTHQLKHKNKCGENLLLSVVIHFHAYTELNTGTNSQQSILRKRKAWTKWYCVVYAEGWPITLTYLVDKIKKLKKKRSLLPTNSATTTCWTCLANELSPTSRCHWGNMKQHSYLTHLPSPVRDGVRRRMITDTIS